MPASHAVSPFPSILQLRSYTPMPWRVPGWTAILLIIPLNTSPLASETAAPLVVVLPRPQKRNTEPTIKTTITIPIINFLFMFDHLFYPHHRLQHSIIFLTIVL